MPTKPKNPPIVAPEDAYAMLDRAEQLITSGWCKNALALTEDNQSVHPVNERAVKWCELGAMQAVTYYPDQQQDSGPAYRYLVSIFNLANANVVGAGQVHIVNDANQTTHELVIKMFQRAKTKLCQLTNYVP